MSSITRIEPSEPAGPEDTRPRLLLVAYKIAAGAGSEDGSGYHIAAGLARSCRVTLITRINNARALAGDEALADVELLGVDVPRPLGSFKRGGRGIILYYYLWQVTVGLRVRRLLKRRRFDVIHQLNFHTDWAPHFLPRAADRRLVWGPIAHHRVAPRSYFAPGDAAGEAKEAVRAVIKRCFWRLDPFLRSAIRRSDVILYANDDLAPPFRRARRKISFRPYAGSFTRGEPAPDSVFRVLFVGRLVALKGPVPALRAFARLRRELGDSAAAELVFVGDGPQRDVLERLVGELGCSECVRFAGWVDQEELHEHYRRASVFLFPSVEAQGLVVAEALAHGIPVICTESTGPAFLAGPAAVAAAPGPGLVDRLAAGLSEAHTRFRNPDGRARAAAAARARYDTFLDWPVAVEAILAAYRG
ncbi:MAG TPA: glycosyltransferase [Gaiellaceae bacterium]|nr:glycosyltransferase [Gaiellaceae bacterium]